MTAAALLEESRRLGLRLSVNGDKLHVEPMPPPEMIERLKAAKPSIMAALKLQAAATEACWGLTGYITPDALLAELAPEDLAELNGMPDPLPFLRSFAIACVWTAFRRDGIAPPTWDQAAHCERCGPVYLWASIDVAGCPWCWNRRHGVKIPRPPP